MLAQLVQTAGFAASVCIGLIFLIAGVAKLRHRDLLPGVIANYRVLPDALVTPASLALPLVELAVGAALLLGNRPLAPLLAMLLLTGFAGAMAVNIRRGRLHIDCGCGQSALAQTIGWPLVVRNLLLAAALLPRLAGGMDLASGEIAVAVLSGLALFLLYTVFNTLNALSSRLARTGLAK